MKVINKTNPYETYGKICGGDTFILAEEVGDPVVGVYIKIPPTADSDDAFNAVCLNDGSLDYFNDDTEIVVVKATLTIE
jgi:hypothetical protein